MDEIFDILDEAISDMDTQSVSETKSSYIDGSYTDTQLLEFLAENGYETSFTNLISLKEGLANGTITLSEKAEEVPVEAHEESDAEQVEDVQAVPEVKVAVTIPVDGSLQIDTVTGKTVIADPDGNVQCHITESRRFLNNKNAERFLKYYLTEDCGMDLKDFELLTEETKMESLKTLAASILSSIEEKLASIDTSVADKSRGDIKNILKSNFSLQDAVQMLQTIIDRDENSTAQYKDAINTVIHTIMALNQNSSVFKSAYTNKKTIMILKYQSLILSLISAISYLISTIIDFSDGNVKIKAVEQDIGNFAPLQSLKDFNKSVDSGEFKTILSRDVEALREYYLEVPVDTMGAILESNEYVPMIINGIKNIYGKLATSSTSNKMVGYLYSAVGTVVLLMSLRDAVYTLFRMKSKVSDMTTLINNFANINNGGNVVSKIQSFVNKFKNDAKFGSDVCKREVEDDNKRMLTKVNQLQSGSAPIMSSDDFDKSASSQMSNDNIPGAQIPVPVQSDSFGFDF